jgi:protein-S-isoprenylcysteine O-methyltransferase Ste14
MHASFSIYSGADMSEPKTQEEESSEDKRMSRFGFRKPRLYPPVWLVLACAALFALHRWLPIVKFDSPLTSWSAWLLLAPGLLMVIVAGVGFKRAKTGMTPFSKSTALVTGGIYRITRNPMYLGMTLALAGAAIKAGSLGAWIPVPLFMAVIQQQFIVKEEIFLTAIYGDEFRDYMKQVRRWL